MSALLFCIVLELRIAIVLWNVQTPYSMCGRFKHEAYMDDTTYLLQDLDEVQKVYLLIYSTLEFSHTCTRLLLGYWWLSHPKKGCRFSFIPQFW